MPPIKTRKLDSCRFPGDSWSEKDGRSISTHASESSSRTVRVRRFPVPNFGLVKLSEPPEVHGSLSKNPAENDRKLCQREPFSVL